MPQFLGLFSVPQNRENCRSRRIAYGACLQQQGVRRVVESVERQQIQYSIWYDNQAFASRFLRKRPQKGGVELLRQNMIATLRSRLVQELPRPLFNPLTPRGQYLHTRALLGNPNAIRMRLAEHVFEYNLVRTQAALDRFQRRR